MRTPRLDPVHARRASRWRSASWSRCRRLRPTPPTPTSSINEVESQDGFPDDWVELKNTGAATSGRHLRLGAQGQHQQRPWRPGPGRDHPRRRAATTSSRRAASATPTRPGSSLPNDGVQVGDDLHWGHARRTARSRAAPTAPARFVDVTPSKGAANVCDTVRRLAGWHHRDVADGVNAFTNSLGQQPGRRRRQRPGLQPAARRSTPCRTPTARSTS